MCFSYCEGADAKGGTAITLSDFTTLKSCTKWLGELAGGANWADEMKAMIEIEEEGDEQEELNPRLLFDS